PPAPQHRQRPGVYIVVDRDPTTAVGAPDPISLEDALRIVGDSLEAHHVRQADLTVDAAGIAVHADWWCGYRRFPWEELAGVARQYVAQRQIPPRARSWRDPFNLARWSVVLRLTGHLLAARDIWACSIEATLDPSPDASRLRVRADGQEVLNRGALEPALA